jgi:LytS/YehU family sensor histidine kinase
MRLTALLRGVLRRSEGEFATLGEEIELIESYLDIERARFEDRLRVTIDAPRETRNHRITHCSSSRWSRTRLNTASRRRGRAERL